MTYHYYELKILKNMKSFKDKVAVVTGAGSGIGRHLSILLKEAGASVAICDVNETTLRETEKILNKYNTKTSVHLADVSSKTTVKVLTENILREHKNVDMLFNNAGVTVNDSFEDTTEQNWDWVIETNLHAVINLTRCFLPILKKQDEAAIVNLSSIFGMITVPNQSAYHVTKFGVRAFSDALSKELSNTNVSVHCVHPGHIGTNIVSNARMTSGPKQNDALQRIMSKLLPIGTSQREMSEFFQKYGMHPSRAANIILNGIKRNKKRIFVGLDAKLMDISQRISPMHYEKLFPIFTLPITILRNKKPLK